MDNSYSIALTVEARPQQVFDAIQRVPDWWSGDVRGSAAKVGDSFDYVVAGVHQSRQKVTELIPGTRIVWHVAEAHLSFVSRPEEWTGTDIVFEIAPKGDKTELRFTHRGLVPDFECHEACSNGWGLLVGGNLKRLIETGEPQPSPW